MTQRSRYADAKPFDSEARGDADFRGLRPREIGPATGVVEHVVCAGERLDLLAGDYFNADRLWWRIADANPEFLDAADMVATFADAAEEDADPLDRAEMAGDAVLVPRARE